MGQLSYALSCVSFLLLTLSATACAETRPPLPAELTVELVPSAGYCSGNQVVLFDTASIMLQLKPATVLDVRELTLEGHDYTCADAQCRWTFHHEPDSQARRILQNHDAYRPPQFEERHPLAGQQSNTRRHFSPGTGGGRSHVAVTLTFRFTPAGTFGGWLRNDLVFTSTAELWLTAPTEVPHKHAYAIYEKLGLGRYLNPQKPADLQHATRLRGGRPPYGPRLHPERYRPPRFVFRCTQHNQDLPLSPHFTLGDYAMDYPWFSLGFPQYVAISPHLYAKLEDLIDMLQAQGMATEGLTFIYGFRPPRFNVGRIEREGHEKSLKEPFSTHQYGLAVDVIVDDDGDLQLDDLNRDGKHDIHDAAVLLYYVNILDRAYREKDDPRMGGAGIYHHHDFWERPAQSPYLHIDVRNYLREDGTLLRWASPTRTWADGRPILSFARIDERGFPKTR